MNSIQEVYDKYGSVNPGDLSGNQKKEMYSILGSMPSEALRTIEEHKMFVEVVQKLRQSTMEDMQLMGKKFLATLESLLAVGEDGVYSNNQRFIYELIQNVDDCEYEDVSNCNLEIQFCYHLSPAKIIFTYNEKGFKPENVFAITGIAEASKNISADKVEIGEKGIGFKSVFGIADKVLIESGMFSFELYKNNFTVPIPVYKGYKPVDGTRLTLEMSPQACHAIYRSLVEQYVKKDAALNKNPILFLNKLTHLKMYFDGFRYIEFDVQRKEPVEKNGILFEDSVNVSIDMKDHHNSLDREYQSDISCYRYTMPITYGRAECVARYGEDVVFSERRHNIIAVFPKITDELRNFKGVMYSFLPTQIHTTAPIILHVPYKLDGSREFVDPQGKNKWFTYTSEQLAFFLQKVYLDFSRIVNEHIITYIPNKHSFFFKRDNEKIACLCVPMLQGDQICKQKVFLTADGSYESADKIVAFPKEEVPEDALRVHRLLGVNKKLFIPPYTIDMIWYNVQVISNITSSLFRQGMSDGEDLEEILVWLEKNNPDANYAKLIINNEPLKLTRNQFEVISRHKKAANAFLQRTCDLIQIKKRPQISFADDCQEDKTELKDTIEELVDSIDLESAFETYLKAIKYRLFVLPEANADFVLAGSDGIVLSGKNTLSSFAKLSLPFDPRKTFSATLQIRQASEQLNDVDESISNDEYLKLLRGVRISLKSAFGNKMYNSYIRIIRDAGTDKSRFLNELLQNADDCLYTTTKTTPHFILTMRGDVVQATYNEDGFTKDNVRALTAMGESTKKLLLTGSTQSIGEKGVGFKSVFGVATSVEIHSNGFDFRLTDNLPTVPEKCEKIQQQEGTTMVFRMKKDISSYFSVDRILQLCICLRNLKELVILNHTVKITERGKYRTVEIDGQKYRYEKIAYDFSIADQEALTERNINGRNVDPNQQIICYIPDKVKDRDTLLYSGLPTTIQINVLLIIDAPFELTTSRENILHNKWNEYVRGHMYKAILNIMELKKDTGLEMLRYVGFRSAGGVTTWKNFEDDYLNSFNWATVLREQKILPVLGTQNSVSASGSNCVLIPEFIAKLREVQNVAMMFPGTIIDTIGKSQYVPLLETIGCRKAKGSEILSCLERITAKYISDEPFRNGLYAYLSGNQGNIAFEGIGDGVKSIPFIPVRTATGTEYIRYQDNIYSHKTEVSRDDYYILNSNVLAIDTADKILGKKGRINELTQEVFDAKYRNNLEAMIKGNRSLSEKARYILREFEHNTAAFKKCEATLKGLLDQIPFEMENGNYKTGKKFINVKKQYFAGPLILTYTVSEKYEKLAHYLNCPDILKIHYDDFDIEIEEILDDDIEDLQCEFENFFEIISRMINAGLISDEQIERYNLDFGSSGSDDDDDVYEEFPEQEVKNVLSLRTHIQSLWKGSKNPYVEKQYIQWKPKYALDKKNYAYSMYQSMFSENRCFCQMCRQKVHKKYIERNDIEKAPAYAWNQMYLNLCLTCSKDYISMRYNDIVWGEFINAIMAVKPSTAGKFEVPIGNSTITFTATHIAEVQEILKTQGWGRKSPKRVPKLGKSIEDQIEAEKRAEEKETKKGENVQIKRKHSIFIIRNSKDN